MVRAADEAEAEAEALKVSSGVVGSLLAAVDDVIDLKERSAHKQTTLSNAPQALHMLWINGGFEAHKCIAPDDKIQEIIDSMWQWRRLNPDTPIQLWHCGTASSAIFEQLDETSLQLPPWVQLRSLDEVIDETPSILMKLFPAFDLRDRAGVMLPRIFLNPKVSVYFKADLARLLVAMYQLTKKPTQGFMYADSSIVAHDIADLFAKYPEDLQKFGVAMANSSFYGYADGSPVVTPSAGDKKFSVGVNVAYPGFENSAFIARVHTTLFNMIAFTLHPFMDRDIMSKVITTVDDNASQLVFSMMRIAFSYGICRVPGSLITLNSASPKFMEIAPAEFLRDDDLHPRWPASIGVFLKRISFEFPSISSASVGDLIDALIVVETCFKHSCLHPKERTDMLSPEVRKGIILRFILNKPWGMFYHVGHTQIKSALQEIGCTDCSVFSIPVMGGHELVKRSSHFSP